MVLSNNVIADDFAEYEDAKLDNNIINVVEQGKAGLSGESATSRVSGYGMEENKADEGPTRNLKAKIFPCDAC